jgi:hypothetical protein
MAYGNKMAAFLRVSKGLQGSIRIEHSLLAVHYVPLWIAAILFPWA